MKTIRNSLYVSLVLGGFVALFSLLHAQEAATNAVSAMLDWEVELTALEQTTPLPATDTLGNFYSTQHLPGTESEWPPLPADVLGLPVWSLGDGFYVLDDTNVDYDALAAAAAAAAPKTMSMMARSFAGSYGYGNPVYLTNMAAIPDGSGNMTASFNIAGGTNFVPYDILTSSNLATSYSQWTWLGIGYTLNNYTFFGQSADLGFYILAKPSKTMTLGLGDDSVGQCDVPAGLTNALQVAGGEGQSLALKADGTVVAWGQNGFGEATVPTNLVGAAMVAAGGGFSVVLQTNGSVVAWGDNLSGQCNVPSNLTNATVISAQTEHTLALRSDGTVVAWGYDTVWGETNVPVGLSNVTAISAGFGHNLVVSNGFVVAWGDNAQGQCNVPAGLSNVVDVAAGVYHSLALLNNGTVVAWGDDAYGETNVPAGLTNVVAIAAGGDFFPVSAYSLALKSDGTVVMWGDGEVLNPVGVLNNVIAIGSGLNYALAVRTGPPTPVITLEPTNQYQIAGGSMTFNARGAGLYGVTYQWQTNGVNLLGATNAALILTNVQAAQAGSYDVVVSDNGGMGNIVSSNANFYLVTPPVITSQSLPTNQVCIYGNILSFAVTATAPGQTNGFPLSYQWKFNGTNIPGANMNNYSFTANDNSSGIYSVIVANAAGSASANWWVTVTNAINVMNDLLLIYNTNSADSTTVLNYYLAHRPMVSGANVLGIGCTNGEITGSADFTNQILAPYLNWLTNNPAKHPQYLVLFLNIPSRVEDGSTLYASVQYQLATDVPGIQPYVTSINMNGTNDCFAYINKLASFATNSPGQLIISASTGNYGNTNYILDNARHGLGYGFYNGTNYGDGDFTGSGSVVSVATNSLIASGVSPSAIIYNNGLDTNGVAGLTSYNAPQITSATNVAGYICWGEHSALGETYGIDGTVKWKGNSGWWIIETVESFNGQVAQNSPQGNFIQWFSSNAFGGTNYSNSPIGAVTHVEEPQLPGVENSSVYFGLWAAGKNFAICAWSSRNTGFFQAVGDPFATR